MDRLPIAMYQPTTLDSYFLCFSRVGYAMDSFYISLPHRGEWISEGIQVRTLHFVFEFRLISSRE